MKLSETEFRRRSGGHSNPVHIAGACPKQGKGAALCGHSITLFSAGAYRNEFAENGMGQNEIPGNDRPFE